jgi:hypothetical protein
MKLLSALKRYLAESGDTEEAVASQIGVNHFLDTQGTFVNIRRPSASHAPFPYANETQTCEKEYEASW